MQSLITDIQRALNYIEEHITDEMSIDDIAGVAYLSPFYFQRIFHTMLGLTVGEYIRARRLSLAGNELLSKKVKIIDLALKYGYDSPDSFSRAFSKYHGVSPSAARVENKRLNSLSPLKVKIQAGDIDAMNYKIVEKSAFTIVGVCKRFNGETSYTEIPKFWDEHYENGGGKIIEGMFGVCLDGDGTSFDYMIADMYQPWKDIPDGCITKTIEAATWAVFPWEGQCPEALQTVNTQIWNEWLPNCK